MPAETLDPRSSNPTPQLQSEVASHVCIEGSGVKPSSFSLVFNSQRCDTTARDRLLAEVRDLPSSQIDRCPDE